MFSNQMLYAAFLVAASLFLASCSGGSGGNGSTGSGNPTVDAALTVSAITGDLDLNLGESKDYVISITDADGIDSITTELLDTSDAFVQLLSNTNVADEYRITLDSSGLAPGTYRIQVTVVGVDGGTGSNSETTTVTFDVEVNALDAPLTVSSITGATGITVGDTANYAVSISDDDGIDEVITQLKDSSDVVVTALANSNVADAYTLVLDSSGLAPGIYTIEVVATGVDGGAGDNSGPTTLTTNVQVNAVPNDAPSASNVGVADLNGGLALVGDTLVGSYDYSDTEGDIEGASTFQWLRDGSAIAGANTPSYGLVTADSGTNISFEVTPVAVSGTLLGSSALSSSINVANSAPIATNIAISDANAGDAVVGDTLLGSYDYSDADADAEGTTTFRWLRDGAAISGATNSSYTLVAADADTEINFEVTPVAASGSLVGVAVTSTASNVTNSAPVAENAAISDANGSSVVVGDELTGSYDYSDVDSDAEGTSTFRWLRDGAAIAGATGSSYTLVASDSGTEISFEVTPVAASGEITGTVAESTAVTVVNSVPVAENLVVTDANAGSVVVGDQLDGSYDYSDVDSDTEGTSTFRWLRDGAAIAGATSDSYTLVAADSGTEISFEVTPVAATGETTGSAVESAGLTVTNSAPTASSVSITDANGGSVVVGDQLDGSYSYSDIDNDLEGTSTFRWLRDGAAISGATADSYTLVAADSGAEISFEVTPVAATGETTGLAVESTGLTVTNSAPTASSVSLTDANGGSVVVGDQLDGSYSYSDIDNDLEGTSTFRWLRDGGAISGATGSSYTLVAADSGTDISFEVTPVAATGETTGLAVVSSTVSVINSAPVADNVAISDTNGGLAVSGDSLQGSYDYSDLDGDVEGTTTFRWLRDGVAIAGATSSAYTLIDADVGEDISFEVTPIASTGETTGIAVESSAISVTNLTPTASVVFPSTSVDTFTDETSITVRGTASDADGTLASVEVNGVAASTSDGYANWTASISLSSGDNDLTVSVTDNLGASNASADSLTVRHEPTILFDPIAIAEDIANDVIYLLDTSEDPVIYEFDTVNETYSVVSSSSVGTGDGFGDPVSMVFDSTNDVLIVSDLLLYTNATPEDVSALLEVDISTGNRTIIAHNDSLATAVGSGVEITQGYSLSLDGANQTLLVADFTGSQVVSVDVDPSSGTYLTRTQIAAIGLPQYISVDTNVADTAYIYQPFPSATFSSIVLSTGTVTTLSSSGTGTGDMPEFVSSMVFDSGNDQLLVADSHTNTLHAIDTSTGNRTVISDDSTGTGIAATGDMYLDVDATNDVLLVATEDQNGVIEFDLSTSARSLLTPNTLTSTGTELSHPSEIIADSANSRYLVLDANANALVAVDDTTGVRTAVASITENLDDQDSSGMAIDTLNDLAYVVTNNPIFSFIGDGDDAVIEVNLSTGANTVISQNGGAGSGDALSSPSSIAFDSANDRVLIIDTTNWVVAVDTASGARSNLSNASNGTGTSMVSPKAISLDETNEIAYVADDNLYAIFAVDISTGANAGNRTILSDGSTGTGTDFESPTAVWFDDTNDRVLVTDYDGTNSRIFAVDTTTGNRTVLADLSGSGAAGDCPVSFTYEDTNGFVVGVDACSQSILLTDLATDENVVFSK